MSKKYVTFLLMIVIFVLASCEKEKKPEATSSEHPAGTVESKKEESASTSTPKIETPPTAREQRAESLGGFRNKSLAAMEAALGRPIQTVQDAINAAYREIGWDHHTSPTHTQDIQAYQQGLDWGYNIDTLIAQGRDNPFSLNDLADEPLPLPPRFLAARPAKTPVVRESNENEREAQSKKEARVAFLEKKRLAQLEEIKPQLDSIEEKINLANSGLPVLENLAKEKSNLKPMKKEPVDQLIQNLMNLLNDAATNLDRAEATIKRLETSSPEASATDVQ